MAHSDSPTSSNPGRSSATLAWWLLYHLHVRYNIRSAYLMTGGGILHLCNALSDLRGVIESCFFPHEQLAGFAAEGESKATNSPTLVLGTSGPGATNLLTSIVSSYQDSVPLICITGQCKTNDYLDYKLFPGLRQAGTFDNQFTDSVASFSKSAICLLDPLTAITDFDQSIHSAVSGRPGPAVIEIPLDIQGSILAFEQYIVQLKSAQPLTLPVVNDLGKLDEIIDIIASSASPVLFCGRGCSMAASWEAILAFSTKFEIPIVTTYAAKDPQLHVHSHWQGVSGLKGSRSGNLCIANADVILSLGNSLHQQSIGWDKTKFAPNAKVIYVDIDATACIRQDVNDSTIVFCVDLNRFLAMLNSRLASSEWTSTKWLPRTEWLSTCSKYRDNKSILDIGKTGNAGFSIYHVFDIFNQLSVPGSSIVVDSGTTWYVSGQCLLLKSGQTFITSAAMGSMGFALPAATGIAFSQRCHVYCLLGDGSLMSSLAALWVISRYRLNITILVLNNSGYNSISNTQTNYGDGSMFGSTINSGLPSVDFMSICQTCDIAYFHASDSIALSSALASSSNGPCLVDAHISSPNKVLPFVKSMMNPDGTFTSATLDELEPSS